MGISSNIKKLRELREIKPAELARKINVDREMVYAWEAGKYKPSEDNLGKLARFFGVSEAEIIYGSEENLTSEIKSSGKQNGMIPFYDAVAIAGFGIVAETTPMSQPKNMINPGTFFRNAEGALQITGHSMFPKYPSGCIVAYRTASKDRILWGEDYVIELQEDRRLILKRIEKSEVRRGSKV